MSNYFVVTPVKHNGKRYARGDEISMKDADALLKAGVLSEKPVVDEVEEGENRIQSAEEKAKLRKEKGVEAKTTPSEDQDDNEQGEGDNEGDNEQGEGQDDGQPYEDMEHTQLKDIAKDYGLPTGGVFSSKEKLIAAIREHEASIEGSETNDNETGDDL